MREKACMLVHPLPKNINSGNPMSGHADSHSFNDQACAWGTLQWPWQCGSGARAWTHTPFHPNHAINIRKQFLSTIPPAQVSTTTPLHPTQPKHSSIAHPPLHIICQPPPNSQNLVTRPCHLMCVCLSMYLRLIVQNVILRSLAGGKNHQVRTHPAYRVFS